LVNDGVAAIVTTIVARYAIGEPQTLVGGALEFVREAGGRRAPRRGARGRARVRRGTHRRRDDPDHPATIAAYGSFIFAEQFHLSGVVATVAAGMVMGSSTVPRTMSENTASAVESFWEYAAFALNSVVFLLIGLEVRPSDLFHAVVPVGAAYVCMILVRMLLVGGVTLATRRTSERLSRQYSLLVSWGGLRGALSMVLALSLPENMPQRQLVITMTYGTALLSLLVNGLSIAPLLRFLGLAGRPTATSQHA
jgi:CPA1 family monovalent cation:H+ antiporter